jgi:predicted nucleotidyltransferase
MTISIDERVEAIRRSIPALDKDPAIDSYWVTGSVTAGFGTPTSDFDITVVAAGGSDGHAEVRPGQYKVGGRRVDVEVRPIEWFDELVGSVGSYVASSVDGSQLYTPEQTLKSVAQLHAGVRIVKDSPHFARTRAALEEGEIDFRRLLIARAAMYANNTQEDLVGFIADGDCASAALRARDLLGFGVDAWTTAQGEYYPGNKWLWRRLNKVVTDRHILDRLWEALVPGAPACGSDFIYAHQANALNQTLLAQSLLSVWSSAAAEPRDPVLPDPSAEGLWRTPGWTVNRLSDQWCISDRRTALHIPVSAAICWAFANGLSQETLTELVVATSARWFGVRMAVRTAESVLAKLIEVGAIADGGLADLAADFYTRDVA